MSTSQVNEFVLKGINKGSESSFKILYNSYFTYLCTYATSYTLDPDKSQELVNDVFLNVWHKRASLGYPIHSYLLTSVRNASLNYLRTVRSHQGFLDGYERELIAIHEEYCINGRTPIKEIEMEELQVEILRVVNQLPERCKLIFKEYLYAGKSPKEIAAKFDISINTVRVQIKIAIARIKEKMEPTIGLFMLFLLRKSPLQEKQ